MKDEIRMKKGGRVVFVESSSTKNSMEAKVVSGRLVSIRTERVCRIRTGVRRFKTLLVPLAEVAPEECFGIKGIGDWHEDRLKGEGVRIFRVEFNGASCAFENLDEALYEYQQLIDANPDSIIHLTHEMIPAGELKAMEEFKGW